MICKHLIKCPGLNLTIPEDFKFIIWCSLVSSKGKFKTEEDICLYDLYLIDIETMKVFV